MILWEGRQSYEGLILGNRASYLLRADRLGEKVGFTVPKFVTLNQNSLGDVDKGLKEHIQSISEQEIPFRATHSILEEMFMQNIASHLDKLIKVGRDLESEKIIVRASPVDEHLFPDLSFAGVYKSYFPKGNLSGLEHLMIGTAKALAGRFTKYGDYYYNRHNLRSNRQISLMYMCPFFDVENETPLIHGTAYYCDGHLRNEYVINPSQTLEQRDSRLMVRKNSVDYPEKDSQIENNVNFYSRMLSIIENLQNIFKFPLDIEYLVSQTGQIYIVQIRGMSKFHLKNWRSINNSENEPKTYRSGVINSVGDCQGEIWDLRQKTALVESDLPLFNHKKIIVINHEEGTGISSEKFIRFISQHRLSGIKLIVDHGLSRIRDHLQYALVEDPGIEFVIQTHDPEFTTCLQNGEQIHIVSTGLTQKLRRVTT